MFNFSWHHISHIALLLFLLGFLRPEFAQSAPAAIDNAASAPLTLAVQWVPQSQFAGIYMAEEKGYFASRGVDIKVLHGGPGINTFDMLKNGKCDFATGFLTDGMVAYENGTRLHHLAQYVNRSSLILAAWRKKGITSPADLDGRRVSIWPGNFQVALQAFFNQHKIQPIIRPQYYSINLFLKNGVDACCVTDYNEFQELYLHGVNLDELTLFRMSEAGLNFPEDALFTTESFYANNTAACYAVRDAIMEGWRYAAAHREETVDSVLNRLRSMHLPANPVLMKRMLDSICASIFPANGEWVPGKLSEKVYHQTADMLQKYGHLKSVPPYDQFVDTHP